LIGDSISIAYTLHVRGLLAEVADVHRPPENCESTLLGLKKLDQWLGSRKWDVIHFNWGLHDLKVISPEKHGKPSSRVVYAVAIEDYEKNLQALVRRLQKTGARLVWATTTPFPGGARNRLKGDEAAYNAVARKIMAERGIQIDDLHTFALQRLQEIQLSANVHFTPEGSLSLARQVAARILEALKTPG
jgi:acyl-CoA thioesterase-1